MRITTGIAFLMLMGCGSSQTSGTSSKSSFADEFKDAPEWVRTNSCAGSSVKGGEKMICGVGEHPIASRRALGLARSAAAAKGRARIARGLSTQINTLLDAYQGEWAQGVADEQVDFEQRTREAVEEVAKLKLTGAAEVDSWISRSDTIYVLVALDHGRALQAVNQNSRMSEAMKRTIDRHSEEAFDKLKRAP